MSYFISFFIKFFKPQLTREQFYAYFDKLPNNIEVSWFRDGKFIIGRIDAEGYKFMTQAISAKEFIEMVNDAILSIYEIPKEYFSSLEGKLFIPTDEEFQRLNNEAVRKSKMDFKKDVKVYAV